MPRSRQYSNSLYHFTDSSKLIEQALQRCAFTLNYVREDFSFLDIPGPLSIAFPMLCFCDILDESTRLKLHAESYGNYALSLKKEWGFSKGIQPVHYLIPTSLFVTDLRSAFERACKLDDSEGDSTERDVSNFLVTVLAYAKPVFGPGKDGQRRCLEDECEWRYVPRNLEGLPPFLPEPSDKKLKNYQHTLWESNSILLSFSYEDIDGILVPSDDEVQRYIGVIDRLDATEDEKDMLKDKLRRL